jgi:hypothetical protein
MIEDPVIRKGLYDELEADAVEITAGDSNEWFIMKHCYPLRFKNTGFVPDSFLKPGNETFYRR